MNYRKKTAVKASDNVPDIDSIGQVDDKDRSTMTRSNNELVDGID